MAATSDTVPANGVDRFVAWLERLLLETRVGYVALALLGIGLLKHGINEAPNLRDWLHASSAFPHERLGPATLRGSPIGYGLAHLLHADDEGGYVLLHLTTLVVALATALVLLWRRAGRSGALVGAVLLFASPLTNVSFVWVGSQDPFVVLGAVLVALAESAPLVAAGAAVLGLAGPEMAVIVVGTSVVVRAIGPDRSQWAARVAAVAGLAVGVAVVEAHLHALGVSSSSRESFFSSQAHDIAVDFAGQAPAWLYSVFGAGWLFVALTFAEVVPARRERVAIGLALVGAIATTPLVLDETRVAALCSSAVLLGYATLAARRADPTRLRRVVALTVIAATVVPSLVVWEGRLYDSDWHRKSFTPPAAVTPLR